MYHMIQNYSRWLVLRQFFDDPNGEFTIRLLSKRIKLATTSVRLHLDQLSKGVEEGYPLVIKSKGVSYPVYKANWESNLFRFYKKIDMLFKIKECGLVEKIEEEVFPEVVILFGSASKGEDTTRSDIDIFLLCKGKEINLERFEKFLNRSISLHFANDLNKLPKELRNNIINGMRLSGYLEVF